MAIMHYSQEDFNKVPVLGLVVYSNPTAPGSPVLGQLWEDTSLTPPVLKYHNGTDWVKTDGSDIPDGTITDAKVASGAAIARSKLNFGSGLVNTDIASGAAIAKSKLDFGTGLTNSDISATAAIAKSKLDFGTGLTNSDISATANIARSKLDFGSGLVNADIASGAAIARSKLDFGSGLVNADIAAGAAIVTSKISGFDTQVRTSRLDQMAAPTAAVSFNGQRITNLATPSASTDAVNKQYVDDARAGIAGVKDPVRAASTTNVNLSAPGTSIGGVTMATNDRFLAANQTTGSQNGIYVYNGSAAAATRATDADTAGEILDGTLVAVSEGTYAGNQFIQTATPSGAPGSWTMTWTVYSTGGGTYTAGAGLTESPAGTFNVVAADGSITVNADNITVGNVSVAKGGTGATDAAGALTNLGITAYQKATGALGAVAANSGSLAVSHGLTVPTGAKAQVRFFANTTNEEVSIRYRFTSATQFTVYNDSPTALGAGDLNWVMLA